MSTRYPASGPGPGPGRGGPGPGGPRGQGLRGPGAEPPGRSPAALPPDYLKGGYLDANGYIRPEVVTTWAQAVAELLARGGMKKAQLRNFFVAVRQIEQRLRSGAPFDSQKVQIARLGPLAEAAAGRNPPLAPPIFPTFMRRNTELAQTDPNSFNAFMLHFEAVVAYRTGLPDSTDRRR